MNNLGHKHFNAKYENQMSDLVVSAAWTLAVGSRLPCTLCPACQDSPSSTVVMVLQVD